VVEARKNPEN